VFGFVGIGRRNGLVVKVKVIGFFFRQGHIFISFFIMEEGGGEVYVVARDFIVAANYGSPFLCTTSPSPS
jgi:hypothetical protein